MSEEKRIAQVSEEAKRAMQRISAEALPINPSAAGWKPTAIRDTLWKAIYGTNASVLEELVRVIGEVNDYIASHEAEQGAAIEGLVPRDTEIAGIAIDGGINSDALAEALKIVGIKSISQTNVSEEDGGENILEILLTNGEKLNFSVRNGSGGAWKGNQRDVHLTGFNMDGFDNYFTSRAAFEAHCSTALARRVLTAGQYERDDNGSVRLTLTDGDGNSVSPVNGTIYLIPSAKYSTNSIYEEYLYFNSASGDVPCYILELIGTTEVDLSDYYKKDETYAAVKDTEGNSVTNLLEVVYPIGSIYMSVANANPHDLFGFGTWEQIQDTFLLAAGSIYAAGVTGGEAKHTLTEAELPHIAGYVQMHNAVGDAVGTNIAAVGGLEDVAQGVYASELITGSYRDGGSRATGTLHNSYAGFSIDFGQNQAHNNMPRTLPYMLGKEPSNIKNKTI